MRMCVSVAVHDIEDLNGVCTWIVHDLFPEASRFPV